MHSPPFCFFAPEATVNAVALTEGAHSVSVEKDGPDQPAQDAGVAGGGGSSRCGR